MKKRMFVVLCAAFALVACGSGPDLIVTALETTGPATINAEGSAEVPIRLTVKNQGSAEAPIFKVSTGYTGPDGNYTVAFTAPGQSDMWYPHTTAPLIAGSEAAFSGMVTFHPSLHDVSVSLKATADSCSGDEFVESYCRVQESNEGNNDSALIAVTLP